MEKKVEKILLEIVKKTYKKMWKIIFFFFLFSFSSPYAFAVEKIEDVFIDIEKDYVYYNELQSLYEKGMINPDLNNKFDPNKLLTRDEFIGIAMEVGCSKCIKPYTVLEYILQYGNNMPFYDVKSSNDYGYCIADAFEKDVVKWYSPSYKCQDGTTKTWETPFCTNNNITLEEAVAFLLRNSAIFTIVDNQNILTQIEWWLITQDLSNDIKVKNIDGSTYTFYWYFKKALEFESTQYDIYGNSKKYSFIEKDSNGNINPKKYITKQDFIKMAYMISQVNSCTRENGGKKSFQTALQMSILDKTCNPNNQNCKISDLKDWEWVYDFKVDISNICSTGIKNAIWIFYNTDTKETYNKEGVYLDNYKLPSQGNWIVRWMIEDNCGNQSQTEAFLNNKEGNKKLSLQIQANNLSGTWPLSVEFKAITECENCTYIWNFWDGNTSNDKNVSHIFQDVGNYSVQLTLIDQEKNTVYSSVSIQVKNSFEDAFSQLEKELGQNDILDEIKNVTDSNLLHQKLNELENEIWRNDTLDQIKDSLETELWDQKNLSQIDSDKDGVMDDVDKCPTLNWDKNNFWCPILDQVCLPNSERNTCDLGYTCSSKWYCEPEKQTLHTSACIVPQNGSSIFWNVMCNSCPCEYKFDFLATIRKCDVIIPAIVSSDGKQMYGKWNPYEVPYDYK